MLENSGCRGDTRDHPYHLSPGGLGSAHAKHGLFPAAQSRPHRCGLRHNLDEDVRESDRTKASQLTCRDIKQIAACEDSSKLSRGKGQADSIDRLEHCRDLVEELGWQAEERHHPLDLSRPRGW